MADFSTLIQNWFRRNKRNLPWRGTKSAYEVWLSEIILQQTRVDQGTSYYLKFIASFPKIEDLANAKEDDVLNLWQGLGYYSRARNMHASAKRVVDEFEGEFPTEFEKILSLKGVGEYTASAVSSIVYGLPHAVVDGNVYRVLSRYYSIKNPIDSTTGKKIFKKCATELLDTNNPGDHNQAIMELGALVCLPKKPKCSSCPLNESCSAYYEGDPLKYPVKEKKNKVRKRKINYLVITDGIELLIKKRKDEDIWKGLYDFPSVEEMGGEKSLDELIKTYNAHDYSLDGSFKHILSHQKIEATFWLLHVSQVSKNNFEKINKNQIEDYPLPQLLIRYIRSSPFFNRD